MTNASKKSAAMTIEARAMELKPDSAGRRLHVSRQSFGNHGIGRIDQ
jgi:hypothetical protein